MNCPTCSDQTLVMTERAGVEIDYCPTCRGVWLDRGELDKIVERSTPDVAPPRTRGSRPAGRGPLRRCPVRSTATVTTGTIATTARIGTTAIVTGAATAASASANRC